MTEDLRGAGDSFEIGPIDQGARLVRLAGDWLLRAGMTPAQAIFDDLDAGTKPERLVVDLSGVGRWDSALVSVLVNLRRGCEARSIEMEPRDMPEGVRRLVDLALAVPEQVGAKRTEKPPAFLINGSGFCGLAAQGQDFHQLSVSGFPQIVDL